MVLNLSIPQHCTTVLKVIINYYIRRNSNIYCCFLDASKAFDKIHFGKLFKTLISKKVPPLVISLIFNSYIRQEARVSWGSHFSCYFHLRNGVKQGGVISAQLFTVYIDKLLLDLKHSGYGCHLGDTFTGVLSYADDITLICPSLRGMNCVLKICSDFAQNFSLTFNSNKSMCIKFGESVNDREKIMLNDLQIAWVNDVRHLGNYINKSLSDKLDCQQKLSTFIGSVNKLNANFRNLQHDVIARLFKSHCCSFYGSQAWRIDSPDYKRICISWNKSVRNILRLPYTTHTWILGPLLGQPHIHCQLQQRTLRFLCSIQNNNNILVSDCWKYASNNANSPLGYNIAYFRNSYGIDILPDVCVKTIIHPPQLDNEQHMVISELNMLLLAKGEIYNIDGFTKSNIDTFIKLIATDSLYYIVKLLKNEISKPLTVIINQMLKTGIFPDSFKTSKIVPLFKKGDHGLLTNYRPISLLPTISKVFERVIYDQMYLYFNNNNLLADEQFGFRKNHSTEYAAIKLVDHISNEMESGKTPVTLFIDLSKAFDTLSFDILLQKLNYYGIAGVNLKLMANYLRNRKQYVVFNNHNSEITDIRCGVPQGSILGPLFFSICINDLKNASNKCKFLMYADDTTIYFNIEDFNTNNLEAEINKELEQVNTWLKVNKLSLNVGKTKMMIFHRKRKHIPELKVLIDGCNIECVNSFNFLGIMLDQGLSWNNHVDLVKKKFLRL